MEAIVGLLIATSIASERLVEIIKSLFPWLSVQKTEPGDERRRQAAVQTLAIVAGAVTALLTLPVLRIHMPDLPDVVIVVGVGVLSSGGSGLWNTLLTYFLKLKDVKAAQVEMLRAGADTHPDLKLGGERVTSNECYDTGEIR
jgi:hypothetical protein